MAHKDAAYESLWHRLTSPGEKKKNLRIIFAKLFITEARKQSLKTKVAKNIIQDTDASTAANV